MSEVKVNKLSSRTGNAVTLGNTSDTLTVPSDVTITAAGTVSGNFKDIQWQSVVTADGSTSTTAEAGKGYPIDTTSAAHTINLPASPSAGDSVAILDYAGTFGTNNVTLGRNSSNIQGAAANGTISTNRRATTFVYIDSTQGWIAVNDNTTDNYGALYVTATGGTETTSGDYKIHSFTSSACFVVSCAGNSGGSTSVDYLVVGGGGGGGNSNGGGGGAGGFRMASCFSVSVQTYPITIGAGGNGQPAPSTACSPAPNTGSTGSNSVFSTITSAGGGGGGSGLNTGPGNDALAGGSGGGGGTNDGCGGAGNTPPVSPSQGNSGGDAGGPGSGVPYQGGGGGGGAATAGSSLTPSPQTAGPGGAGSPAAPIFGTAPQPFYIANGPANGASVCGQFAGGGGGGSGSTPSTPAGSGGVGGGANGTNSAGTGIAGTTNTGGGGGGGKANPGSGGNGGSGIVLIRYKYQ